MIGRFLKVMWGFTTMCSFFQQLSWKKNVLVWCYKAFKKILICWNPIRFLLTKNKYYNLQAYNTSLIFSLSPLWDECSKELCPSKLWLLGLFLICPVMGMKVAFIYVPFIYSVDAGSWIFSYVRNRIRLRPGVLTFDRIKAKVRDESG